MRFVLPPVQSTCVFCRHTYKCRRRGHVHTQKKKDRLNTPASVAQVDALSKEHFTAMHTLLQVPVICTFFLSELHVGCEQEQEVSGGGGHLFTALHVAVILTFVRFITSLQRASQRRRTMLDPPLHYAAENGHLEVVGFLVNCCGRCQRAGYVQLRTCTHFSARNGHLDW